MTRFRHDASEAVNALGRGLTYVLLAAMSGTAAAFTRSAEWLMLGHERIEKTVLLFAGAFLLAEVLGALPRILEVVK